MPTGSDGGVQPTGGAARSELFPHDADVGVRGVGPTLEAAFEQAALALTSIVTENGNVAGETAVTIECEAPNEALLLVDWLNAIIYRMAVDRLVFGRFKVRIDGTRLHAEAWGEPIDRIRHAPAVEPKGATFTALEVRRSDDGTWTAQCVVDV
jgi:tRNA nucleotidyltransferase (CCA-adding enzyme)